MSTKVAPPEKKQDKLSIYIIKLCISFFFMFAFGYICPPFGTVTSFGVKIIGIFIGICLMVTWFDAAWPPLLALFAIVLTDYISAGDFITKMLGNTSIFQMIILLGLSFAMRTCGIGEIIAKWIITRKSLQGRPVLFITAFYWAIFFSAIFMQYGAFFLGWEILYEILEMCGYKKKEKTTCILVIGVFSAAFLGYASLPISGLTIAMVATFNSVIADSGFELTTAIYAICGLCAGIVVMPFQALAVKYIFRADLSGFQNLDIDNLGIDRNSLKPNAKQLILVFSFFIAVFYAVALSFVSAESAIGAWMNKVTQYGWFVVVIAAISIIRYKGEPVFNPTKSFSQGVFWGPLLCTGSFVIVGAALVSDDAGIKAGITQLLTPLFGNMSWIVFVMLTIAAVVLITNFMSNLTTGVVIISLIAPFVVNYIPAGINPCVIGAAITISAMQGELTMSAGAYAPLLVCNEYINGQGDTLKYGSIIMLVYVIFGGLVYSLLGMVL